MKSKPAKNRVEKLSIIKARETSGLSKASYCRAKGIRSDTFSYWQKQYRLESEKRKEVQEAGTFISLGSISSAPQNMELLFPNGLKLRLEGELSIELLKRIKDA